MNSRQNNASEGNSRERSSGNLICWFSRAALWTAGAAVIVFGAASPALGYAEGTLTGASAFALSLGIGLVVVGSGLCGRLQTSACWFAVGLVGQAAALQAVNAGRLIHYQHYLPPWALVGEKPWALLIIAGQAALVVWGMAQRWQRIRGWLTSNFKVWQLVVVSLAAVFSSAALSPEIGDYLIELMFASMLIIINLANLVLIVWTLPEDTLTKLQRAIEKVIAQPSPGDDESGAGLEWGAFLGAAWVMGICALLSYFVYQRHPHVPDEVLYLFQARYLAQGRLSVPAAPVPEAFSFYLLPYKSGQWYSIFPPGWPAILAVGARFGAAWLVNPILAGVNVLLSYKLARQLYSRRLARWTVFLLCVSPWYIFMGMNFMSHTLALTLALGSAVTLYISKEKQSGWYALLSGIFIGALSLVRPYDALIMGALLAIWALAAGRKQFGYKAILLFGAGVILSGVLVLPYNYGVMGSAFKFPLQTYYAEYYGPKANALGFGPERGLGWALDAFQGHTPLEALINAGLNLFSVNIELYGWSIGSILLVSLFLVSGGYGRSDWKMISLIAGVTGFYSLYWFNGGPDFGARYWYLVIFPLVVLTVRGIEVLTAKLEGNGGSKTFSSTRVFCAVLAASLLAVINFVPWRAVDKYHHYLNMRPDVLALDNEFKFGNSILLVQGSAHPDYASTWVYNPLDYSAPAPIYAWDADEVTRSSVLRIYEDRSVWILKGPSLTGNGYAVVEGPISAKEALEDD